LLVDKQKGRFVIVGGQTVEQGECTQLRHREIDSGLLVTMEANIRAGIAGKSLRDALIGCLKRSLVS
jgi:hypothetical protein